MSKKIVSTLAGLILLLTAVSLYARNLTNQTQVTVPFEFVAGSRTLPAGNYSVELKAEPGTIVLRTDGQQPLMLLATAKESVAARKNGQLIFHRYGTSWFLTEVWTAGNGAGRTLATSAREKELARKNRPNQEIVVEARNQ